MMPEIALAEFYSMAVRVSGIARARDFRQRVVSTLTQLVLPPTATL